MKIDYPKEWYEDSAQIEGEAIVGCESIFVEYDDNNISHVEGNLIDHWDYDEDSTVCKCIDCQKEYKQLELDRLWATNKYRLDHL